MFSNTLFGKKIVLFRGYFDAAMKISCSIFFYKLWESVRRCSRINTAFIPVGGTESPMPNGLGGQVTSSAEAA